MNSTQIFKKGWASVPLIVCSVILMLLSDGCKKDVNGRHEAGASVSNPDAFYNLPNTFSSLFQRIANEIKKEDQSRHFLDQMIAEDGLPIWDKSEIHVARPADQLLGANNEIVASDTVVFVPLVLKNTTYVNSFFVCRVGTNRVSIKIFKGRYYKAFGYSIDNNSLSAEAMASKIMHLDYLVFGYTFFKITDPDLFAGNHQSSNNHFVNIAQGHSVDAGPSGHLSLTITYTECNTIVSDGTQGQVVGVAPGENNNYSSVTEVCYPVTVYIAEDAGGGSTSSGGTVSTTSGGTGGSGSLPGSNPCPSSNTQVAAPLPGCPSSIGWQPVPAPAPTPTPVPYNQTNINSLSNLLVANPSYLINPCNYINQYTDLLNHVASPAVQARLTQVNNAYNNSTNLAMIQYMENPCYLLDINDASSAVVNFDYFPIHINALPTINGSVVNPQQLFDYFRKNWNSFVDNTIATFTPYKDPVIDDTNLWNSSDPTTALLHLKMISNGSVIVSQFTSSSNQVRMIVKTVRTPLDGTHPVSGNRMWGISPDPNGGYNFYTSGVDRITGVIPTVISTWADRLPLMHGGFQTADALWTSLQNKMIAFINANGGSAKLYTYPNFILRPKWEDVDAYLKNQITLNELLRRIGC